MAGKVALIALSLGTDESAPPLLLELELERMVGRTVGPKWAIEKISVLDDH